MNSFVVPMQSPRPYAFQKPTTGPDWDQIGPDAAAQKRAYFSAFKRPTKRFGTPIGPYSLRHNHLLLNAVTFIKCRTYSWIVWYNLSASKSGKAL